MDYFEVNISISPFAEEHGDIVAALLAEIGFDSFTATHEGINAYIPAKDFEEKNLKEVLSQQTFGFSTSYTTTLIKSQNWNEEWEKNFSPISIEGKCHIRAPFHPPQKGFQLEIVIEPKMAFGTGHHETTWLVLNELFTMNLKGKKVLDMGSGTGILAIAAEKLGATEVIAVDNDSWAYENAQENIVKNGCTTIQPLLGDISTVRNSTFDVILANINLNTLKEQMSDYAKMLTPQGQIVMSGILNDDLEELGQHIKKNGLEILHTQNRNKWSLVAAKKP